ncbi:hypothetical protein ACCO45_006034 [Purpureocillium lilacinum]|uniref:Uncharacterized protein n=1 Tax=Purpureocillium lilacinum TaxID=33203 RepID=A0ACC4DYC1_PURLI
MDHIFNILGEVLPRARGRSIGGNGFRRRDGCVLGEWFVQEGAAEAGCKTWRRGEGGQVVTKEPSPPEAGKVTEQAAVATDKIGRAPV